MHADVQLRWQSIHFRPERGREGRGQLRAVTRRAGGSSSNTIPPISTSSPGSNPRASSAAITPMRRSRCSTCASASSFSRSWRAIRRSTASPVTRNSPSPTRSTSNARPRPGGRRGTRRPRPRPRPRRATSSGRHAPQQLARELVEPLPRGARGDDHRHVSAEPRAPRRRGGLGLLGRDQVGLREREDARQRASRGSCSASSRSITRVVLHRVGAVERREVEHVHEQPRALDVREEVVPEPRAGAGALDQPGMSAITSWRSSASSVPSTGSSVVNG